MYEVDATFQGISSKGRGNYHIYELQLDDELLGSKDKLYVHNELFKEELAEGQEQTIIIRLVSGTANSQG